MFTYVELERQQADLKNTHERQIKTLQDELDSCVKMVADAFDKYVSLLHCGTILTLIQKKKKKIIVEIM